jgi:quercetin dioxygenase-like cupin family protein
MISKHFTDVPGTAITKEGFKGMNARFVLTKYDGCTNYAMRVMEFDPGGHTSLHAHAEEHEFFFLEGEPAYVDGEGNVTRLEYGDLVYVEPYETHQIKNLGNTVMRVVCTIPILSGGDGIITTKASPVVK